jgi:hypothetical protein
MEISDGHGRRLELSRTVSLLPADAAQAGTR